MLGLTGWFRRLLLGAEDLPPAWQGCWSSPASGGSLVLPRACWNLLTCCHTTAVPGVPHRVVDCRTCPLRVASWARACFCFVRLRSMRLDRCQNTKLQAHLWTALHHVTEAILQGEVTNTSLSRSHTHASLFDKQKWAQFCMQFSRVHQVTRFQQAWLASRLQTQQTEDPGLNDTYRSRSGLLITPAKTPAPGLVPVGLQAPHDAVACIIEFACSGGAHRS